MATTLPDSLRAVTLVAGAIEGAIQVDLWLARIFVARQSIAAADLDRLMVFHPT